VLHLPDGRAIRRQYFGVIWRKVRVRAGLPQARFHDTRRTFASTLLGGGVSVPAAADWLGHTPGELLSTYAHLLPGDVIERVRLCKARSHQWRRVTITAPRVQTVSKPTRADSH
jgi:integrase